MRIRKTLGWLGLTLLILSIALLRFPMAIAAVFLPQPLALQGASGTIWQGEASALGLGGMVVQQHLSWQFQPRQLLSGSLVWQVQGEFRDDKSRMLLKLRPGSAEIQQAMLVLPLEPLIGQSPKMKGLKLGGVLHLDANEASLKKGVVLEGRLENLSSGLTPSANPFGSYRFHLSFPASGAGSWQIATLSGALKASGEGTANILQGKFTGEINLDADEANLLPLKPVLSTLPKGDKGYTLNLSSMMR